MTADQIKAMSDDDLSVKISVLTGQVKGGTWRCYSTDLNAAWPLQYGQGMDVIGQVYRMTGDTMYPSDPRRCARLISEAFLWLKTKGE